MYYRKAEGKLEVKLSTYRIRDGRPRYDYFVLDVDVVNSGRVGTSKAGWSAIRVRHANARVVDYSNTKSISFHDDRDCVSMGVGLSTPWPIVSASMSLGHVTFCDEGARYSHTRLSGSVSEYFAGHIRQIKHVSSQRVIKVRNGDRPTFTVAVKVPVDDCTSLNLHGSCDAYDNKVRTRYFKIGTVG